MYRTTKTKVDRVTPDVTQVQRDEQPLQLRSRDLVDRMGGHVL